MTTEQYSIGYDEGYQAGWNEAMEANPAQQQEPVAWATMVGDFAHVRWGSERPNYPIPYEVPLYTTPPHRKPLTGQDYADIYENCSDWDEFARAIEAAHGIKENT